MGNGYNILFEVAINHDYYNNKVCNDFDIIPTTETLLILKNYRLLFKKKPSGFAILGPLNVNGTQALINLDKNIKFSFQLKLQNIALLNFTKLSNRTSPSEMYRFVSSSNSLELNLNSSAIEIQTIRPKVFALSLDKKYDAVTVKVYNDFEELIYQTDMYKTAEQIEDSDFNLDVPINLERGLSGLYKFAIYENDSLAESLYYYISDELKKSKPFGIIDIYNVSDNLLDINTPKNYKIEFEPKKIQWYYIVKLNKDYTGSTIVMEDKTTDTTLGFLEYSGEPEYKEGTTLKFKSIDINNNNTDYEIPFLETPLKKLEITITKNPTDITNINITNIANPSINHIKSEVFINI